MVNEKIEKNDNGVDLKLLTDGFQEVDASISLSDNEIVDLLGNWNLAIACTLLDDKNFEFNSSNLAHRMNILKSDAEGLIESIKNMGLIRLNEDNKLVSVPIKLDDSVIESSDLLSAYVRFSEKSLSRIMTSDLFGFRYELMSKKIIQKYIPDLQALVSKMVEESKLEDSSEVYAFGYSFCKATQVKR